MQRAHETHHAVESTTPSSIQPHVLSLHGGFSISVHHKLGRSVLQGIPRGMDREQTCKVLNLMAEEVGLLAAAAHGADDAEFWTSTCSIMESYAELHTVLPGLQCDAMFEEIGKLYADSNHKIGNRELAQIARVYATKPFNRLESSNKVIATLFRNMKKAGVYSQVGASGVSDVAEALSMGGEKQHARVEAMMQWLLNTNDPVSNEVGVSTHTCICTHSSQPQHHAVHVALDFCILQQQAGPYR